MAAILETENIEGWVTKKQFFENVLVKSFHIAHFNVQYNILTYCSENIHVPECCR